MCVFWGVIPHVFYVENATWSQRGATEPTILGDTPCVREPFRPIFNGRNGPRWNPCVCGPFCPITDTHKPKFAGFDGGVCVCFGGKAGHVLMAETPPGPMCVWVFCESAPGMPKVSYFTVSNAPGLPPKGKTIYCCGSPHPKKNDFRSRYVCVFVHVLMAKTTIGKSMCVFVCNPCVCFVQSVCVCVCYIYIYIWPRNQSNISIYRTSQFH